MDTETKPVCNSGCFYITFRDDFYCRYENAFDKRRGLERIGIGSPCRHPEACEHKAIRVRILYWEERQTKHCRRARK